MANDIVSFNCYAKNSLKYTKQYFQNLMSRHNENLKSVLYCIVVLINKTVNESQNVIITLLNIVRTSGSNALQFNTVAIITSPTKAIRFRMKIYKVMIKDCGISLK